MLLSLASAGLPLVGDVDGIFVLPLARIKNHAAYGIELLVGTPPQTQTLFIDTGSATTGMEGPGTAALLCLHQLV